MIALALNGLDQQNFGVTGLACHHNSFKQKYENWSIGI